MTTATSYTLARCAPATSSLQCRTTRSTLFCQNSATRPLAKSSRVCAYTERAAYRLGMPAPFLARSWISPPSPTNEKYITFSASYVVEGETTITHVGLATRAFPGSRTSEDIEPWIEKPSVLSRLRRASCPVRRTQ